MGEEGRTETLLSAQAPTIAGLAWVRQPQLAALPLPAGEVLNPHIRGTHMHRMVYKVVHKVVEALKPCNASDVRAGATWPGSVQLWLHH